MSKDSRAEKIANAEATFVRLRREWDEAAAYYSRLTGKAPPIAPCCSAEIRDYETRLATHARWAREENEERPSEYSQTEGSRGR